MTDLSISSESFELGKVLRTGGSARITLERIVPVGDDVIPYFWVEMDDGDVESFERSVRERPEVRRLEVVDRLDGESLYAAEWEEAPESLIEGIVRSRGAILRGQSADDRWRFVLRFPSHDDLSEFSEFLTDHAIDIDVERVYEPSEAARHAHDFDITDEQREALVSAVRRGYFEVPRGVTAAELAEELDITRQATSERVRRGANTVLRSVLLEDGDGDGGVATVDEHGE